VAALDTSVLQRVACQRAHRGQPVRAGSRTGSGAGLGAGLGSCTGLRIGVAGTLMTRRRGFPMSPILALLSWFFWLLWCWV